jgi:hypothetical protein
MNKRNNFLTLIILIIPLCLLTSYLTSAWAEPTQLLGGRHKGKGVQCTDCHKGKPPKENIPTTTCLDCHKDVLKFSGKAGESKINPHDNHMQMTDCQMCHHTHKPSEDKCRSCHDFGFRIP